METIKSSINLTILMLAFISTSAFANQQQQQQQYQGAPITIYGDQQQQQQQQQSNRQQQNQSQQQQQGQNRHGTPERSPASNGSDAKRVVVKFDISKLSSQDHKNLVLFANKVFPWDVIDELKEGSSLKALLRYYAVLGDHMLPEDDIDKLNITAGDVQDLANVIKKHTGGVVKQAIKRDANNYMGSAVLRRDVLGQQLWIQIRNAASR